jgi:Asp-tRNA(Asn)/Glu-tRNA(Gln) amidotransferase A subunit family amidase
MTETGDRVGPASHHPGETGDDPSAPVRQPVLRPRGTYISKSDMGTYFAACDRRHHLAAVLDAALASVDVLLTPVNTCTPPRRTDPDYITARDGTRQPFRDFIMGYTVPQNLAGVPSVTIRAGTDEMGLACGVQLTAARGQELAALRLAEILDRELGFATDGRSG